MNRPDTLKPLRIRGLKVCGILLYVYSLTIFAGPTTDKPRAQESNQQQGTVTSTFTDAVSSRSTLPVTQNRFVVDKGISQIDILVNTDQFNSIQLLTPVGKILTPSDPNANIPWQKIEKLYAIRVLAPLAGQWQIQGNLLSYPEVIVSGSIDMITPLFPNNLIRGETLALSAYLQEEGKKISEGDILKSTQIMATLQNIATAETYKIYLINDEKLRLQSSKGLFCFDYLLNNPPGVYRLDILATGLMFQREKHQQFYLYDYPGTVSTQIDAQNDNMVIKASLESPLLDLSTCQVSATMQLADGSTQTVMLDKKDPENWQFVMPASREITKMSVVLAGYLKESRQVQITFPEVNVLPLYNQAYLDLEQNLLLKSNQEWQRQQKQQVEQQLPFSINKQIESYIVDANLIADASLKPLAQYPTYIQSMLTEWEPKIVGNQEETWMKSFGGDDKKKVLSKDQFKTNLLAAEKAKVLAKSKQEAAAKLAYRKKMMIMIFAVFCFMFIILFAGLVWYLIAPLKRKSEEEKVRPELSQEPAPAKPKAKPEGKAQVRLSAQAEADLKPEKEPKINPTKTPEIKPVIPPEVTPETQPEIIPEVTPEITPDSTPEIIPVNPQASDQSQKEGNDQPPA